MAILFHLDRSLTSGRLRVELRSHGGSVELQSKIEHNLEAFSFRLQFAANRVHVSLHRFGQFCKIKRALNELMKQLGSKRLEFLIRPVGDVGHGSAGLHCQFQGFLAILCVPMAEN